MKVQYIDGTVEQVSQRFKSESGDTVIGVLGKDDMSTIPFKVKERRFLPLILGRSFRFFGQNGRYLNKRINQWISQFQAYGYCAEDDADAVTELMEFLHGRRFPRDLAIDVVADYGDKAMKVVQQNPFKLLEYPRCGFKLCDAMYLDLGKDRNRTKRQTLCAAYDLASNGDGSTWHHLKRVEHVISSHLDVNARVHDAVRLGSRSGTLAVLRTLGEDGKIDPFGDTTWVATKKESVLEISLAEMLLEHEGVGEWPELTDQGNLSDHQWEQVQNALREPITLLIGGGGTGKTHTVAHLIREIMLKATEWDIALCAPTGKAAVRMSEAMSEHGINIKARTIHSLLGYSSIGFLRSAHNLLPYRYIFVDESSMIDLELMHSLIAAVELGACVMLIGDPYQLPPVGPGAPFRDMIEFLPGKGELIEVRRNSGRIVSAGNQIRKGDLFDCSESLDVGVGENLLFIETSSPEESITEMFRVIKQAYPEHDPVWQCQVLAAVNKRSELSTSKLNEVLQAKFNPGDTEGFRVNDKVMNTSNTWATPVRAPGSVHNDATVNASGEVYVANGEQGVVLEVHKKYMIVEMFCPKRVIMVPTWEVDPEDSDGAETGCKFTLAYAITIHKSQGAQFPVVIGMVDDYAGARRLFDRSMIYTLISRATKYCVLIGSRSVANAAVRKASIWNRKTFLRERYLGVAKKEVCDA